MLTPRERENLQHALGLDRNHRPWRNWFAAEPGSPDDRIFVGLAARGLAALQSGPRPGFCPDNIWRVTTAGMAAAGAPEFVEGRSR